MFRHRDAFVFVFQQYSRSPRKRSVAPGVLEDVPPFGAGTQHRRAVRVVFEKEGSEWQAFPGNCSDETCLSSISVKYPLEIVWTVAFDGRSLGQITSRTPERFAYYAEVGLQNVTSKSSVPIVGSRSRQFGGQTDASVYGFSQRPTEAICQRSRSMEPFPIPRQLNKYFEFGKHFGSISGNYAS